MLKCIQDYENIDLKLAIQGEQFSHLKVETCLAFSCPLILCPSISSSVIFSTPVLRCVQSVGAAAPPLNPPLYRGVCRAYKRPKWVKLAEEEKK